MIISVVANDLLTVFLREHAGEHRKATFVERQRMPAPNRFSFLQLPLGRS